MSAIASSIPCSTKAWAFSGDRVRATTACPRASNWAISGRPIAPVPPAMKIFIYAPPLNEWNCLLNKPDGARPQLPIGYSRTLFLAILPNRRILDIARVQDDRQEAGPGLVARVPGHAVHAPRRFVERFPGLVSL